VFLGWFETSLNVANIAASIAFYEALGFVYVEGAVEVGTVTLNRGDCRLTVFQGHLDPPETQLIFWQGDVEAIAADLASKGLRFEAGSPKRAADGGVAVMLKDPDGHPIYIITMPVHFLGDPAHERPAPASRPRATNENDLGLGRYELGLDVTEIERAIAFYEALGFSVLSRDSNGACARLQHDDCRIALHQGTLDPAWAQPGGRSTQYIFSQGDVGAIARDLESRGYCVTRGANRLGATGAAAMVRDPDGHPICFVDDAGRTPSG